MKHMQKPDYLTDEELMDLIASVEIGAKLSAPGYLKESILKKAVPKNRKKQHELLFFSAKITAAAAAAILLLFTMPDPGYLEQALQPGFILREEDVSGHREDSFLRKLNQKANSFCGMLADGANSIFEKEDH
ncbi:hypothetical protein D3Z47_01600 [Lachnospiraceae bacterium]|nr:hypothetical protein [Lachnospiraceae bacterium]